jgi:hypothetical protein
MSKSSSHTTNKNQFKMIKDKSVRLEPTKLQRETTQENYTILVYAISFGWSKKNVFKVIQKPNTTEVS